MRITLLETMRAGTGRIPWLDRHLDRMLASAQAYELHTMPTRDELTRAAVDAVARRRATCACACSPPPRRAAGWN